MTDSIECAVIGAGVVGLAVARALALAGREVVVLESAETIGTGISSRNSEVIHAGIYYAPGSNKARFCVEGRDLLYAYCAEHGVAHRRVGKLVVATEDSEIPSLEKIRATGEANGVHDLEWLDREAVARREPAVKAAAALWCPSTGMLDAHGLMLAYQGDGEAAGAAYAFHSPVTGGRAGGDGGILLEVGGDHPMRLKCRWLINSAGLGTQAVAASIQGVPARSIPRLYPTKGNYFILSGPSPFNHLIYPVPTADSLGLHLSTDMGGQTRFGPDVERLEVERLEEINYEVDARRQAAFEAAIRRYWPGLPDGVLYAGYAGVRPKTQAPGQPPADFVIQDQDVHGVSGLINLYGIESPGLTSSLAIAGHVAAKMV